MAPVLLHEVLDDAARRAPDQVALVTDAGAQTFAELADRVARVAAGIAGLTASGDRVAILAENRAEYVECYYAVPSAATAARPAQPAPAPGRVARGPDAGSALACSSRSVTSSRAWTSTRRGLRASRRSSGSTRRSTVLRGSRR